MVAALALSVFVPKGPVTMDRGERGDSNNTNVRGIIQPVVSDHSLLGQEVITPGGEINLKNSSITA